MTKDELKKKIVKVLEETECEWTEDKGGYISQIFYDKLADALIAAGIGDVKEAEMAANRYEMLYSMQARDMALAERKAFTYAAEIEHLNNKLNEDEHRAKVAERALELMARGECTFASPEYYKKQAEKEIAEEKK